ncbi:MAG: hypothetical protein IJF74_07995 [Clostridia bacterium]|nr:hypothetical protein [Clostridia bacterium]
MQELKKRPLMILLLVFIASFLFAACGEKQAEYKETAIVSVLADEDNEINVKAQLSQSDISAAGEGGRVYLFAVLPGESVSDIGRMSPVAEKRAAANITFVLDRDASSLPLLYAKFVLAVKNAGTYEIISPAAYVENPEVFARYSFASTPISKKGLAGVSAGEAEALFASQTVIDVPVDILINCEHGGESCGIGVETYKVCAERLALLDHQIRTFSDSGITVYLRFVINSASGAERALPLAAVTAYLCERYADSVSDLILAFDLGAPVCDIHTTAALLRAFRTAAVSVNDAARVYFSASCIFETTSGGGSRALLEGLFDSLEYNGAIPFGIALDMSAAKLLSAEVWNDPVGAADLSGGYITVRNLEMLEDFLHGEKYLFDGRERDIVVTDFSVRTEGDNGENVQATAIAYGYYKALSLNTVRGIVYAACADEGDTAGLRDENGEKKSYGVFAALNTERAEAETEFALRLIGVNRWASVVGSFNVPSPAYSKEYLQIKYASPADGLKQKMLFDFTGGASNGFYPSDGAVSCELAEISDGFELLCVLDASRVGYGGISARIEKGALKKARLLTFDMGLDGEAEGNANVRVLLSGTAEGKCCVWSADGRIVYGSDTVIEVDISSLGSFREEIDRIKILTDAQGEDAAITLRSVQTYYKPVPVWLIVLISVLALVLLFGLFVLILYLRMLYYEHRRKLRAKKRLASAPHKAGANRSEKPKPRR